mmetsp:Transcript_11856/g.17107  ORF Transcript_11856/g.17107 Transcript_11856/m.17107 type:complete len:210 (-) Transcript_11856:229-858(-)
MDFSRRPRRSKGTTMARAGRSTDCTNVTPAMACIISGTSLGLVMAVKIFAVMCSISLFPITSREDFIANVAASLTCFFVSHMQAVTSGTISGRAFPSCLGAVLLKTAMHSKAVTRTVHFFSTGSCEKIAGRRLLTAKGDMLVQMAIAVLLARVETSLIFESVCSSAARRHTLVKASAAGASSARALTVVRAAIASASLVEAHFTARTSI